MLNSLLGVGEFSLVALSWMDSMFIDHYRTKILSTWTGVSWGGIKNPSKSTWCQSALIQFSINKTFQTALKMAQEIYVFARCHGEKNYLTIIYVVDVKEVSLTPLFHYLTKDWIVCVRVDVGIPEIW